MVALGGMLLAVSAAAQDYPSRPINMVIPFPPGGNTDLMARALQPELAKALGQPVVVVNKGGAGGTIGDIEVADRQARRLHDRADAEQSDHRAAARPEAALRHGRASVMSASPTTCPMC